MVFIWTKWLVFTQMLLITDGAAEKKSCVTETKEQERKTRKGHDVSRLVKIFISWKDKSVLKVNTFIMWTLQVTADPSEKILTTVNTEHYFLGKIMQPVKATFIMFFYVTKIAYTLRDWLDIVKN